MAVSGQETPSRSGGRPEYKPTDEQRALVRQLRGEGKNIGVIALAVGISRNTLRKHFTAELASDTPAAPDAQLDLAGAHRAEPAPKGGRPAFEPTERQRNMVRLWAADDWSEDRMARQLGISRETLRKHFDADIQYGADKVRTEVLLDLQRSSREGKVAASNKLLERTGLVAPPAPPRPSQGEQPPEEEAGEQLGKKAQARVDAKTAEVGTGWADLVH